MNKLRMKILCKLNIHKWQYCRSLNLPTQIIENNYGFNRYIRKYYQCGKQDIEMFMPSGHKHWWITCVSDDIEENKVKYLIPKNIGLMWIPSLYFGCKRGLHTGHEDVRFLKGIKN